MSDIVERLRLDAEPSEGDMETAAQEIEKLRAERDALRAELKQARRDALKEAWLVVANKSVPETPVTFEEVLERDIEMMNAIRALGEKE